jgi:hypothetical protein
MNMNVEEAVKFVIKGIEDEKLKKIKESIFLPLEVLIMPSIKQTNITPRQQNQFIIFRKDRLAKIRDSSKDKKHKISSAEFSKYLSNMWKNESKGIINIFKQLFEYSKKVHKLVYPAGYRFSHRYRKITKVKQKFGQKDKIDDEYKYENVSRYLEKVPNKIMEIPMTNLMKDYDKNILREFVY